MTKNEKPLYSIPVTQLLDEVKGRRYYINRKEAMHYCSPSAGGWGVVRVACLVPEVEVLFVIPMGCGRHGAIASFSNQTNDKLSYLLVEEVDIVIGSHLEQLEEAIEEIIEERSPRGLIICSTCMDDLLGSDYTSLEMHIEEKYKLPVKHGKMNPIMAETRKAPELMIQQTIYDFIQADAERDNGLNIIGSFVNIHETSELALVLEKAGIGPIRHISDCETFDAYQKMSSSSVNLLVHTLGSVAVKHLKKTKNQEGITAYQGFTIEVIDRAYEAIGAYCGKKLDVANYRSAYIEKLEKSRIFHGKTVAIGTTINARPFELARFLSNLGFDVRYILAKAIPDVDKHHVEWLEEESPDLKIMPNLEPSVGMHRKTIDRVDYCFGLDAAILFEFSHLVELPFDEFLYGYLGAVQLIDRILSTAPYQGNIVEQIYNANLVI